jgi:fructosamine-3-kinase
MSAFAGRVASLVGLPEARQTRLGGGDLSEVLLIERRDGHRSVAKGGASVLAEAAMLRALAGAGVPVPRVEGEHDGILLLEHVPHDGVFNPNAWASIGAAVRCLHETRSDRYGWPVDYRLGTVELHNRRGTGWHSFWGGQRLLPTASLLDRPWRDRVGRLAERLDQLIPDTPPPALLHGDLWAGNILVRDGRIAALIDPACYYGDAEVDLAMLTLFGAPPEDFWAAYGALSDGWEVRRHAYQLFPALVHLRLFGGAYAPMVDRLLRALGV